LSQRQPQGGNAHDCRQATTLFFFEEDLREQAPESDRGRVDGVFCLSEIDTFFGEDLGDALIRDERAKGQLFGTQKRAMKERKLSSWFGCFVVKWHRPSLVLYLCQDSIPGKVSPTR
jgi:hypothetical protein